MGRKSKGKLPRVLQKALQDQQREIEHGESIDPFVSSNPALHKPPDLIRPPIKMLPASTTNKPPEERLPALRPPNAMQVLEEHGETALVGYNPEGGNEFWITLKQEIFGGLQLHIRMHQGQLSANLIAPSAEIQRQLQRHVPALQRHLKKRGFQVATVEITHRP